mmetsp:Transcript_18200/g.27317  ORF Transcript_18200/g.27317 Transcript_18200/m.27317 type:complete len:169 (+) Transcript_18200:42-548(+)
MSDTKKEHDLRIKNGAHAVVAIDGTKDSDETLEWCAENLWRKIGKLTLIHVYNYERFTIFPVPGTAYGKEVTGINAHLKKKAVEDAEALLKRYGAKCIKLGYRPHELKLLVGKPVQSVKLAIHDFIEKCKPDMLIVGTRGLKVAGRIFQGSVSDFLLHNAKCTVIVVK